MDQPLATAPPHRIYLDALLSSRYAGPASALWGGGLFRATLPIEAWSAGVWVRFDAPAWALTHVPAHFSMSEVAIGLSVNRRIFAEPFELRVGFEPSVAVISMEGGPEQDHEEGGKVDARLGLALRGIWPISRSWRFLGSLDGEFAPAALGGTSSHRRIDPDLPPAPAYTLGVSLGVGVGLP